MYLDRDDSLNGNKGDDVSIVLFRALQIVKR
jgi:hypothetical protein